ncbi:hypothetical protein LCGC14_1172760 [marine sediment metagenome]|uniref:Zinc-ribbon domain-containing protein n=1 Tax=marine sediment metagenome TaxID=412755 RepID=A0A0F9P7F2_9ZZZZ
MAWIPIIAGASRNKGYCRRGKKNVVAGILFSLVLGVLFFFIFGFRGSNYLSTIPWILIFSLGIFMMVIVAIGAIAASIASPKNNFKLEQEKYELSQHQQLNPYIIQKSSQVQILESFNNENRIIKPVFEEIHYCSYCGSKMERDVKFCPQCGSRL